MTQVVSGSEAQYSGTVSANPNVHSHQADYGGKNSCLVAVVVYERVTADLTQSVTSLTYDGVDFESVIRFNNPESSTAGYIEDIELFYLLNPADGANDISMSLTNAGQDYAIMLVTLEDVDSFKTVGAVASAWNTGSVVAATTNITVSRAGAVVISAGLHTGGGGGVWTPETSDGENIELIDLQVDTGDLGFTTFLNHMTPEPTDQYLAGGSCTTSTAGSASERGTSVIAVEFLTFQEDKPLGPAIIKVPWTKQPPAGTKIDWNNPLTKGLISVFRPHNDGLRDVINDVVMSAGAGDPSASVGVSGRSVRLDQTTDYIVGPDNHPSLVRPANAVTVWTLSHHHSTMVNDANRSFFRYERPGFWNSYGLEVNSLREFSMFVNNGSRTPVTLPTGEFTAQPWVVSGKWSTGEDCEINAWKLGGTARQTGTGSLGTVTGPITYDGGANESMYCGGDTVTGGDIDADIYLGLVFDRKITDVEDILLAQNPWQIFKPRKIYIGKPKNQRLVVF